MAKRERLVPTYKFSCLSGQLQTHNFWRIWKKLNLFFLRIWTESPLYLLFQINNEEGPDFVCRPCVAWARDAEQRIQRAHGLLGRKNLKINDKVKVKNLKSGKFDYGVVEKFLNDKQALLNTNNGYIIRPTKYLIKVSNN